MFLLLVFPGVAFGQEHRDQPITCPQHTPRVFLTYDVDPVEYVRTISSKVLTEQSFLTHAESSPIIGLAGGDVGTRFDVRFKAIAVDKDLYCMTFKSINVVLYSKPKVAIASDFIRGSCEYSHILHHELKHVKILERAHKEYLDDYRGYVKRVSRNLPVLQPVRLVGVNRQKIFFIRQIENQLMRYVDIMMKDIAIRQRAIDTEEEYKRVHSKCDRWEQKLGHGEDE